MGKSIMAVLALLSATALADIKNGTAFQFDNMPEELTVQRRRGEPVRFSLEENRTTGYKWDIEWNQAECDVSQDFRGGKKGVDGAPGSIDVTVTSKIYTPARVEFRYRRPWEKDVAPAKTMRLIVYTVGEAKDPLYPPTPVNLLLKKECEQRGIVITDWHLHIRGGMTPEMAFNREKAFCVRSSAMENHGREWEIYDNEKLRAFAERSRAVNPKMPVGIQVNDRDWFTQIDPDTRAKFDYILADSMIMGTLPSGRANRLWMVKEINDPDKWMEEYFAHVMRILDEPISIYANATYLPTPIADQYDRLWTEKRMESVIAKAVEKGIALEIQAESPFPRPNFLRLAKKMGAKFSFGTNNFDPGPKNLSRWLEAIVWLDLTPDDIWSPSDLKTNFKAKPSGGAR
ncbi:MAG: protease inhibitor I42 family protein [Kiritimatiellae bacterium]|nr:protease inhibitor I42 family protein [Kiritimatiellia bacterium]